MNSKKYQFHENLKNFRKLTDSGYWKFKSDGNAGPVAELHKVSSNKVMFLLFFVICNMHFLHAFFLF
jgi:hypothetical protein